MILYLAIDLAHPQNIHHDMEIKKKKRKQKKRHKNPQSEPPLAAPRKI